MPRTDRELELVRDYERQIAELSLRLERLERERAQLESAVRAMTVDDPGPLMGKLRIFGIPAQDLKDIAALMQEWRRSGGHQSMLDWYRETRLQELRDG